MELMKFKSSLSATMDQTKETLVDYRLLEESLNMTVISGLIIIQIICVVCLAMVFFVVILQIEGNIRDNMLQIGILRSMGLRKRDVSEIVMVEAIVNIISSNIIGFIMAYLEVVVCLATTFAIMEMPLDYDFEWLMFGISLFICITLVYVGSILTVRSLNKKSIASIIKIS